MLPPILAALAILLLGFAAGAVAGVLWSRLSPGMPRKDEEGSRTGPAVPPEEGRTRQAAPSGQEAEEERARLAMAVEQAGESIVVTDADGAIRYVNPAFERVTGYRRNEVLG
ncbi:MAG TPA: PAS domain-containing protein, partial [Candidatus Deferrimicrobiaceae bacterium]